ncbi:MAG: hypothetical protein C4551_07095 [Bacillota bacterium]|nr:MAG: hypothetical protein C4551_07095 [Bacillota bacterium]
MAVVVLPPRPGSEGKAMVAPSTPARTSMLRLGNRSTTEPTAGPAQAGSILRMKDTPTARAEPDSRRSQTGRAT